MLMFPTLAFAVVALGVFGYLLVNTSNTRSHARVFVPLPSICDPTSFCGERDTALFASEGRTFTVPIANSKR